MKAIKLMAALAIPAMFAACSNEEIVVESPKQFDQVVGAEIIGTDISMNVSKGEGSSRLGVTGWETTDKLGLGWIVTGEYSTPQSELVAPNNNKWYANHMFAVEDGKFKTKGNAYKGWHFAYFPFEYMESVSQKVWNVNPPQTSKTWASGRVNDALCISPLKFLTRESLDENYQLKESVVFEVQRAVNSIHVQTTAADQFVEGGSLADLDVKSITLSMAGGINYPFCSTVRMDVVNLPQETDAKVTAETMMNSFYAVTNPVLVKTPVASITTDVAEAGFKVSEQTELITLTAPYAGGNLDITKLSMQIVAGSGTFNITYDTDAEEGSNADKNNKALEALKEALAKGGSMTQVNQKLYLDVVLYADIFETDFLHITDLTEWKDAVDLATKLGRETEIFGLDGIVEFNEGNIPMPTACTITVNETAAPAGLKITKNLANWPEGLTANVNVVNEKTISNATGINGLSIVNTGTLKGITGTINSPVTNNGGLIQLTKTGKLANVNNEGGRITVVYGSMVTTTGVNKGVIAYTVASKEYAYKLNNLMSTSNPLTANVNTLIVNKDKVLDLDLTDAGNLNNNDPYYPTGATDDTKLVSLANINIELNGGTIKGETKKLVNSVIMNGGTIANVNLNGKLTIESGCNSITSEIINSGVEVEASENTTITAETIIGDVVLNGANTINNAVINGNVTIANGTCYLNDVKINGTLNINASATAVLNSTEFIYITEIVNNGTLVANNDIFVKNVSLNAKSTTTLTNKDHAEMDWNKVIYYTDTYNNSKMTLNGTVLKYSVPAFAPSASEGDKGKAAATALKNAAKDDVVFLPEGTYAFSETSDIHLTGASLICEPGTVINSAVNSDQNRVLSYKIADVKSIFLKNFTLNAPKTKWDIFFRNDNMTEGNEVEIVIENVNCTSMIFDFYYKHNTTANVKFVNCKIDKVKVHPNHATNTINVEYDAASVMDITTEGNAAGVANIVKK